MRIFKNYSFLVMFLMMTGLLITQVVIPFTGYLWAFYTDSLIMGFFLGVIHTSMQDPTMLAHFDV